MDSVTLIDMSTLPAGLVPLMVFMARVVDVSLGTLRIVLVSQGKRATASILGFLEVFIWLVTISQILQHMAGLTSYLAYAAGFAAGTYVGMTIERKLTERKLMIRVVAPGGAGPLVAELTSRDFRATRVSGQGARGPVEIVFSIVNRSRLGEYLSIVKETKPEGFFTVEDVLKAQHYESGHGTYSRSRRILQPFFWFRKSK